MVGWMRSFAVRAQAGTPQSIGGWLGSVPGSWASLEMELPEAARMLGRVTATLWELGEDGIREAALGSGPARWICSWQGPPGSQLL